MLLCAIPALVIIKKICIDKDSIGMQEWYLTIFLLQTIALPVVNGFVLTSLIQREYQDCTLRNTLCALWIAVSQRTAFYPALLTVLGFAVLETAGMQVSEELLLPASLCPWTAVSVSALVGKGSSLYFLCLLSAALCGAIGLAGALRAFGKQDL